MEDGGRAVQAAAAEAEGRGSRGARRSSGVGVAAPWESWLAGKRERESERVEEWRQKEGGEKIHSVGRPVCH